LEQDQWRQKKVDLLKCACIKKYEDLLLYKNGPRLKSKINTSDAYSKM
jgi:hypothetical protein